MDSNHRRRSQQIYSLSPLATREFPHIKMIHALKELLSYYYKKADNRTRTDNLLITNQLLCQLSHIGITNKAIKLNGAYRARTCDPLLVRQMLSQLS